MTTIKSRQNTILFASFFALFFLSISGAHAQGRFLSNSNMNNDNDWHNADNWTLISGIDPNADGIPGVGDTAELNTGHTCIVTSNVSCEQFIQRCGTTAGTVRTSFTVNAGVDFTVADRFLVQVFGNRPKADIFLNGNVTSDRITILYDETGADIDFVIGSTGLCTTTDVTESSQFRVTKSASKCSFINNGTFVSSGSFIFETRGGQSFTFRNNGTMNCNNQFILRTRSTNSRLTFENNGSIDIKQNFLLDARNGAIGANNRMDMRFTGSSVTCQGNFSLDNDGGSVLNNASTVSTMIMNGTGNQFVLGNNNIAYHHLILRGLGVKTLNGAIPEGNLHGDLTIEQNVVLNQNSFEINIDGNTDLNLGAGWVVDADVTCNGNMTIAGSYTSNGSNLEIGGDWNLTGTYTYTNNDNVTFNGTTAQSINGVTEWYEITIDNASGVTANNNQDITGILDIDNGAFNANGNTITLISDANGTAQMDDIGTGSYAGNITVQRRLVTNNQGWRELSMPIDGVSLSTWQSQGVIFSGFPGSSFPSFSFINAFSYSEANANGDKNNGWIAAQSIAETPDHTSGYRIYTDAATYNLAEVGAPNTGDISIPLQNDNEGASDQYGWNFIGNPYCATIDWDLMDAGNKNGIDNAYWIFVSNGLVTPQYGIYIGGSGTGTNGVDGEIAHHQAFWVHCDGAFSGANPSITFQEKDKNVSVDNIVLKAGTNPNPPMAVRLKNSAGLMYDELLIASHQGANSGYVYGEDFSKLYTDESYWPNTIKFATIDTASNNHMVLSTIGTDETDILLNTGIGSNVHGQTITMEFDNLENLHASRCIVLEDLHLGTSEVVSNGMTHTFVADTSAEDVRFVLHISSEVKAEMLNASCFSTSNGSLEVLNLEASSYLTVMDSLGNTVATSGPTSNHYINTLSMGTYHYEIGAYGCGTGTYTEEFTISAPDEITADFSLDSSVINIGAGEVLTIHNLSSGANAYDWNMGDGTIYTNTFEPQHQYSTPGNYQVVLTATNGLSGQCTESMTHDVEVVDAISVGIEEQENVVSHYSTQDQFILESNDIDWSTSTVQVLDLQGKLLEAKLSSLSQNRISIDASNFAKGIFLVTITTNQGQVIALKMAK